MIEPIYSNADKQALSPYERYALYRQQRQSGGVPVSHGQSGSGATVADTAPSVQQGAAAQLEALLQNAVAAPSSPVGQAQSSAPASRLGVAQQPAQEAAGYAPVQTPGFGDRTGDAEGVAAASDRECRTCASRTYRDQSDDPGVSYQTPTKISPESAASAVRAHENEHVTRGQAKAKREGREVVSQSVVLKSSICPECGKVYISGGTTTTVTRDKNDKNDTPQISGPGENGGAFLDKRV